MDWARCFTFSKACWFHLVQWKGSGYSDLSKEFKVSGEIKNSVSAISSWSQESPQLLFVLRKGKGANASYSFRIEEKSFVTNDISQIFNLGYFIFFNLFFSPPPPDLGHFQLWFLFCFFQLTLLTVGYCQLNKLFTKGSKEDGGPHIVINRVLKGGYISCVCFKDLGYISRAPSVTLRYNCLGVLFSFPGDGK